MSKKDLKFVEVNMSFAEACDVLQSGSKDFDTVLPAWIIVKNAISKFEEVASLADPVIDDIDSFTESHELDDDVVYKIGGKTYKTHAIVSDTIELNKDFLRQSELPSEYFDRSPRLSQKMVKDASKKIAAGEMADFAGISKACQVVTNRTTKTIEVDPITLKRVVTKKEV